MKRSRSHFRTPWLAYLSGLFLVAYLYMLTEPSLIEFYEIPPKYFELKYRYWAMGLFAFFVLFETFWFRFNKQRYDKRMRNYEERLEELLKSKSKLQHKVHQYSDHADKLKLFISDRLLEHIEYDEKFLHFKNIASEVRHNGVICYDKVVTSLKKAIQEHEDPNQYQEALDGMSYLWDLLDLSTTDNIAMYIANRLYESEEHYYQKLLKDDEAGVPYSPTFQMRVAVIKALRGVVNEGSGELPALDINAERYHYEDDRFWIDLENGGELLGNENYIVLLVENLVNNALYYTNTKKYGGKNSRIAVSLTQEEGHTKLMVYNHGPLIDDEVKGQIFQLGFSTKRVRENNGKGLGLYFVHEIVEGYEGEINFVNIQNKPDAYLIRITLSNGDVITGSVSTVLNDKGRLMCRSPVSGELSDTTKFNFKESIHAVEVSLGEDQHYQFDVKNNDDGVWYDPATPQHPTWCLEYVPGKTQSKLTFRPLDISGVQFNVILPTAESRLDSSYHDMEEDELDDLEHLDKGFEDISDYVR